MRYLYLILSSLFLFGNLSAQELSKDEKKAMSKAEKKELKMQIKDLKKNPEKLKTIKENVEVRDITIEQQTEEINTLKNDLQTRNLKIASLSDSLSALQLKLEGQNGLGSNLNNGKYIPGDAPLDHQGYKYRVQIGLFQNFNITNLFDQPKYIVHEDINGLHRYSVGNFNSESDAEAFKVELRRLGIKDAFVTTYKDGTRTTDVKPVAQPVNEPEKIIVKPKPVQSGFNVKPAIQTPPPSNVTTTPVKVNTHIESNPFPVQNGQVISSKPVQVDTKQLNDKINTQQPKTEKTEEIKKVELQERPAAQPKPSGIIINVGK